LAHCDINYRSAGDGKYIAVARGEIQLTSGAAKSGEERSCKLSNSVMTHRITHFMQFITIYSAFFLPFLSPSPNAIQSPQNSKKDTEMETVEM
jgi:hypothetical protein